MFVMCLVVGGERILTDECFFHKGYGTDGAFCSLKCVSFCVFFCLPCGFRVIGSTDVEEDRVDIGEVLLHLHVLLNAEELVGFPEIRNEQHKTSSLAKRD